MTRFITPVLNVPAEGVVYLKESEAAALSHFVTYHVEMAEILRDLMRSLRAGDRALAARIYSLDQESKLVLYGALARLKREADAASQTHAARRAAEVLHG